MRIAVIVFLLALLIPIASAQYLDPANTFSVIMVPVTDKIENDQWADFSITVRNHQMYTRKMRYGIAEEGVEFSSLTQPTADLTAGFLIEGGSIHTTHYQLKPNFGITMFGGRPYNIQLTVMDIESGEKQIISLPIQVYPKGYFAGKRINLSVELIAPEKIDPRNTYSFKVNLRNTNSYDIGPVSIELAGQSIQQQFTATIGPNEEKTIDFTAKFDPLQQPLRDPVQIRVIRDTVPIYEGTANIEIVGYRIPFERTVVTDRSFLKTTTAITLTNRENVAEEQEVLVEAGFLKRRMSRVSPAPELTERDGKAVYRWVRSLQPGQQLAITITTSYRIPVLILVAILIVALFFYLTKDPVSILKYAEQYRMYEGGIVELKVVLSVKNRSGKILEQVQLVDKIPNITAVKEGESFGTLRPHKIVHGKEGVVLKWDIEHMDPEEERIITYVLRAKLAVLGDIRLPPALVIVHDGKSEARIKSNEADVTSRRQA